MSTKGQDNNPASTDRVGRTLTRSPHPALPTTVTLIEVSGCHDDKVRENFNYFVEWGSEKETLYKLLECGANVGLK